MIEARASDHKGSYSEAAPNLHLDVDISAPHWKEAMADIVGLCMTAAQAAFLASSARSGGAEVSLVLADDAFVAGLNKQYRNHDGATNVLSFATYEDLTYLDDLPSTMPVMLGDVVIAFETTANEANVAGIPIANHVSHLVVHGILHLLGYDHISDEQAAVMEPLETAVLAGLGVPDPYAAEQVNV